MPIKIHGSGSDPIALACTGAGPIKLATSIEEIVRNLIGPSPSATVYVKRFTSPNDHYDLWQQAGVGSDGNPYFWRLTMWRPSTMPGDPANISLRIGHNAIERPLLSGVPGPTLTPATPGVVMSTVAIVSNVNPDGAGVGTSWENGGPGFREPGAGNPAGFVGASHGYENETAFALVVDGTPTTMTNGQILEAESILFEKTCELFHPNVYAGAVVASDDTTYTWHQQGYDIVRATTWLTDLQCTASYQAMMSTGGVDPETTDRYSNNGITVDHSMTANNDVAKGMAIADLAWIWKDGGGPVASVDYYNPANHAIACNNHVRAAPLYTWLDDRSGTSPPKINKLYSMRVAALSPPLEAMSNGTVWDASWRYRVRWLANTASLARGL